MSTLTRLHTFTKECNARKPCHRLSCLNSSCAPSQLDNQQILPQNKQGCCKARTKVASARGFMIGSRTCRLRVVFHSQPLPQTRGSRRVQKSFVGASFCPGTWSFPLVLASCQSVILLQSTLSKPSFLPSISTLGEYIMQPISS
jgi:hypothetical protein